MLLEPWTSPPVALPQVAPWRMFWRYVHQIPLWCTYVFILVPQYLIVSVCLTRNIQPPCDIYLVLEYTLLSYANWVRMVVCWMLHGRQNKANARLLNLTEVETHLRVTWSHTCRAFTGSEWGFTGWLMYKRQVKNVSGIFFLQWRKWTRFEWTESH